tara:strand:+ start:400 stop:543 length:144 start_codon:yes stop_codon:yes gene_type:complete
MDKKPNTIFCTAVMETLIRHRSTAEISKPGHGPFDMLLSDLMKGKEQ